MGRIVRRFVGMQCIGYGTGFKGLRLLKLLLVLHLRRSVRTSVDLYRLGFVSNVSKDTLGPRDRAVSP